MFQTNSTDHLLILKRAGWVLVIVGLGDIGYMALAIARGVSYSSSLNIFAVIAGIFLIRGNLRAASLVRWFALFMLGGLVPMLFVMLLFQPPGLILAQIQNDPWLHAGGFAFALVALAVIAWLAKQLSLPAVMQARSQAGRPPRNPRIPLALGLVLVIGLATIFWTTIRSESGLRAVQEARAQFGDDYRYHVTSIRVASSSNGKSVSGVVTAWKGREVKDYRFEWRE